jgi:hypothetical protein
MPPTHSQKLCNVDPGASSAGSIRTVKGSDRPKIPSDSRHSSSSLLTVAAAAIVCPDGFAQKSIDDPGLSIGPLASAPPRGLPAREPPFPLPVLIKE